jgi:UDP-N-acetylmuramoyl-L-alanyl-D-glutamate--2,6-diaminopimelate ligase
MQYYMDNIKRLFPRPIINFYHLLTAIFANFIYGFPSKNIKIIGVTGTKGKTTTVYYLYQLLLTAYKTGYITTIGAKIDQINLDIGFHVTTPDPLQLQKYISQAVKQKIEYLIVETSSHGLDQNRLWGIKFDIGIFTNIDSDHLDYHYTWKNYALAKSKLIGQLKESGLAIINNDDLKGRRFLKTIAKKYHKKVITYSINHKKSDITAKDIVQLTAGISFTVKKDKYLLNTIGKFNVYNALAALTVAKHLGIKNQPIFNTFKNIVSPPGRMEILQKKPFLVIIDFAHNRFSLKIALENLLLARPTSNSKIITVFGCPGLRDKSRRKMGEISAHISNLTIITADDPRTEGVEKISDEIEFWAKQGKALAINPHRNLTSKNHFYTKIPNRQQAIKFALSCATQNDIVYITGMGHQHTICIGNTDYPWNDREQTLKLLGASR